jgi:predicted lipid-binding transport protein (Tim44 family)
MGCPGPDPAASVAVLTNGPLNLIQQFLVDPHGRLAGPLPARGHQAHNGYMGRIIGTILGVVFAVWLIAMAAGGIFATFKTFLIIGLIALGVFIVVWLVAGRSRHS